MRRESGGNAILIMLMEFVVARRATLWSQISQIEGREESQGWWKRGRTGRQRTKYKVQPWPLTLLESCPRRRDEDGMGWPLDRLTVAA
jgi:hypothetical protein